MGRLLTWFDEHRVRLQKFLEERNALYTPPLRWWVMVVIMERILKKTNIAFTKLQGAVTLVSQQQAIFDDLVSGFSNDVHVIGPREMTAEDELNPDLVIKGKYAVHLRNAKAYIENEGGLFCMDSLDIMSDDDEEIVIQSTAEIIVSTIHGISIISVERNEANQAIEDYESIPPYLPGHLVKLVGAEFAKILRKNRERIVDAFGEGVLSELEREFRELLQLFRQNDAIKESINKCKCDNQTSFAESWGLLGNKFTNLKRFCGGLASVFPGTSTVESDFSVIGWEKNEYRTGLTDFSLEAILQCKQYDALRELLNRLEQ